MDNNRTSREKSDHNIIKYLWSNSIFSPKDERNLPYFFKKLDFFKDFSDFELFDLINYVHIRNFSAGESIFSENDYGIGFYLVINGVVELSGEKLKSGQSIKLYPKMYFGEKNLLIDKSKYNVNAKARERTTLAAILSPDLDNMIDKRPRVAVKLIKILSRLALLRLDEIEKRLSGSQGDK